MRYIRNKQVSSVTLDNEICMFESAKSKYYNLNKTGTFIWEILDNPKTFNECLDSISESFEIQNIDFREQLSSFLIDAVEKKIILEIE